MKIRSGFVSNSSSSSYVIILSKKTIEEIKEECEPKDLRIFENFLKKHQTCERDYDDIFEILSLNSKNTKVLKLVEVETGSDMESSIIYIDTESLSEYVETGKSSIFPIGDYNFIGTDDTWLDDEDDEEDDEDENYSKNDDEPAVNAKVIEENSVWLNSSNEEPKDIAYCKNMEERILSRKRWKEEHQ